ncbi:Kiwa anti-phage protein KwaB-like domain-containing protein [Macrococcoides canis]|uniref:Kiwa anti-phage protein KwaB-like domain-containing protein n=1 Tax=Macrococcoides canis TaxID=1855823 RepID=UPI0020B678B6|nr:Kiwa anti-phage protein KwaB-like domain-containing protein [Macrococcus canis]UTH11569.1 DUF4868 domain-containing protein [Macrococcus canis]
MKDIIKEIETIINNSSIKVFFSRKKASTNPKAYNTVHPKISREVENWLKESFISFIQQNLMPTADYNPISKKNDYIDVLSTESAFGYKELIDSIKNFDVTDEIDAKRVKFIIFSLSYNDEDLLIIKRHSVYNKLRNSLLSIKGTDGIYKEVKAQNFINFDKDIDIFIYKKKIYIYNHIAIERIFYMHDAFTSNAKLILDKLERTNKIDNFSNIREKLLDDNRYIRRIAKLIEDDSRVTLFLDDLKKTEKVMQQFNLNINVDTDNQKIYVTDDGQLNELVNLMQDSYYQTLIGERNGIDEIN